MAQPHPLLQEQPDPVAQPLLVSLLEASRMLGVGKSSIYNYVKAGELHIVKQGKRSCIAIAELNHFANRLAREAGVPADVLDAVGS